MVARCQETTTEHLEFTEKIRLCKNIPKLSSYTDNIHVLKVHGCMVINFLPIPLGWPNICSDKSGNFRKYLRDLRYSLILSLQTKTHVT